MTSRTDDEIIEELRMLWVTTTEDTVSAAIARAERLVGRLSEERRAEGEEFMQALRRLGAWLRDL